MSNGLSTIAFLLPEAQVEMPGLADQLRAGFTEAEVELGGDWVRMRWGDWGMTVSRHTDEMVVEECREMAGWHPDDANWQRVARSVGRLEVEADPDPDDQYYNNWLLVSEFLSQFPGVLVFDAMLGEWLGNSASGPE
jgi:hypothetical protein